MEDQGYNCALKCTDFSSCKEWCRHQNCNMAISAKEYSVGEIEWISPLDKEPPRGKKINILQGGGVAIHGNWIDNVGYLGWQDLFKRNYAKEQEYKNFLTSQENIE